MRRILNATVGLFFCGCGIYLMVYANIGLGSWEALNEGIAKQIGVSYGTAALISALIIILLDVLLKEKIGMGMILDAIVTGKTVDLLTYLNILPLIDSTAFSIFILLCGIFILAFGQYIYMKQGIGCGPRDAFLIALGKLLREWPIGAVTVCMHICVIFLAWLIGGSIGLGTVITVGCTGVIMQIVFSIAKFEPRNVKHEGLFQTVQMLVEK